VKSPEFCFQEVRPEFARSGLRRREAAAPDSAPYAPRRMRPKLGESQFATGAIYPARGKHRGPL